MFGSQTLGFVAVTDGALDRNGLPAKTETLVPVSGCRFRPLRVAEKIGLVDNVATEVWQATCPPAAAVLGANAISEIVYDGTDDPQQTLENTFQVIGNVQPFADFGAGVFKVTVLCQKQTA